MFQYTATTGTYCLTATNSTATYYISNTSSGVQQGTCSGYNQLVWIKPSGPAPLVSGTNDAAVFRTTSPSRRLNPGVSSALRNAPFSGAVGETYTVSMWVITDPTWNGDSNSKIRFGTYPAGALLNACSYNGPKAVWTQKTCSFTLTSTDTSVSITVANTGTIGNIWIDDFSISK